MTATQRFFGTLHSMSTAPSRHVLVVALLCVSVLFVHGGGMHLHLCFDGQEAPAEVHWVDAGAHDGAEHAAELHNDLDVGFADGLAKTSKPGADHIFAILAAALLIPLLFALPVAPPRRRRPLAAVVPPYFQPPVRGPPALLSP